MTWREIVARNGFYARWRAGEKEAVLLARHCRMTSAQEIRDRLEGYARAKIASVMQPLTEELLVDQVLRTACHARGVHRAHRFQRVTCLRPSVGHAAGLQFMLSRAAADT